MAFFLLLVVGFLIFFLNFLVPLCNGSFWCSTLNNTIAFISEAFLVFVFSMFVLQIIVSYAYPSPIAGIIDIVFMLGIGLLMQVFQPAISIANSLTNGNSIAVTTVTGQWFPYILVVLLLLDAIVNFFSG